MTTISESFVAIANHVCVPWDRARHWWIMDIELDLQGSGGGMQELVTEGSRIVHSVTQHPHPPPPFMPMAAWCLENTPKLLSCMHACHVCQPHHRWYTVLYPHVPIEQFQGIQVLVGFKFRFKSIHILVFHLPQSAMLSAMHAGKARHVQYEGADWPLTLIARMTYVRKFF